MRAGCITKVQAAEVKKYSLMEDALNGPRRLETIPLVRANRKKSPIKIILTVLQSPSLFYCSAKGMLTGGTKRSVAFS